MANPDKEKGRPAVPAGSREIHLDDGINTVSWSMESVTIIFQQIPGTEGSDDVRGIGGVPYSVRFGEIIDPWQHGVTDSSGRVTVSFVKGWRPTLEIFDTTYDIEVLSELDDDSTVTGKQQRLLALGYELGDADGVYGRATDRAALTFQADNSPLNPDGKVGKQTCSKLDQRMEA